MRFGKKISKRLCLPKEQSNLHHLQQLPILISPRFLSALPVSLVANWSRLTRRRGHVRNGDPARFQLFPSKASFLYRFTSRWGVFGGTFLVEQRRARECQEV